MKVLLVNGSSHRHGTTMVAIDELCATFEAEGVQTEVYQLGGKPLADCLQCGKCAESHRCIIDDDQVNEFIHAAAQADGFVFATPVYYAHPSGRIMTFLDRVFYAADPSVFAFKPGASVAVARRGGCSASFDALNKYFGINQMPVAGSTYWNSVHGLVADEAPRDEEGMQVMRNLARNMTWMMRCFAAGAAAGVPLPATENKVKTNFIPRDDNAC